MGLRRDCFCGATASVRCAIVCRRGRGYSPGDLALMFAFYRLYRGHRCRHEMRRGVPGALTHRQHAGPSRANSRSEICYIARNSWDLLWFFLQIKFYIPLDPNLWWWCVFRPMKSKLDFTFFRLGSNISSLIRALTSSVFQYYKVDYCVETRIVWNRVLYFVRAEVVHGARTENAVNSASSTGGEAKKSVSWGPIKKHKVYVADTNTDSSKDDRVSSSTAPRSAIFVSSAYRLLVGRGSVCWRTRRHTTLDSGAF